MKIGIIGTRGIPNQYGGFEQFTEFIAPALVERGQEVVVYNSSLHPYKEHYFKGVQLIQKNDPENRLGTVGQFIYDLNCIRDCKKRNFDIILQLGYTSSSVWSFLLPKRSIIVTNMDGLEWKRSKYSRSVQNFLKYAEKWAAINSDQLIADSKGIEQYLLEKYHRPSFFIPYGARIFESPNPGSVDSLGLKPYGYNLLIARMEPENNIEPIIKGYLRSDCAEPLIIIGNHKNKFGKYLTSNYASDKILFWGPIYDMNLLNQIRHFSNLYFHGHSVGGTNPSLLEAMASQCLIIAHQNIFNQSILGGDAFYFDSDSDISNILNKKLEKSNYQPFILENNRKIEQYYSWERIAEQILACFEYSLAQGKKRK